MRCCKECFKDPEIRAGIETVGHIGKCPICGKENTIVFDSEKDADNSSIIENLESILRIYKPESELPITYPEEKRKSLYDSLLEDWDIFSGSTTQIKAIVEEIVENSWNISSEILSGRVGIPELCDESYLQEMAIMGRCTWNDFKKSIRNVNRFHSREFVNLNILGNILKDTETLIRKGERFYRARVSNEKAEQGFSRKEMGAPPDDVATPGRANSKGQSCLYLASKKKTTVKEIRAHVFDYVTIATFRLEKDIRVLNLSSMSYNSPFYCNNDKIFYLLNEKVLKEIENDLAKPMSRWDSDLDYLPTQYISDYARYLGYDGVKYNSTFDKEAYNLALFDPSVCKCTYHRNHRIGNLDYKMTALEPIKRN